MTALKSMFYVLTLSIILIMFADPALCISVSYGTNGVSSSSDYHLDTSTTLKDIGSLGDGTIYRTSQVSGSGNNELSVHTSANGASASSSVKSSGVLSATTSTITSGEVAVLSQGVAGSGDLTTGISGSSGSVTADQNAGVVNGVLSASQSLTTGDNVAAAGQNTQLTGDFGLLSGSALGSDNYMLVTGEGPAQNTVNANLISIADKDAAVRGHLGNPECEYLDSRSLDYVASERDSGVGTSTYFDRTDGSLSSFDVRAANLQTNAKTATTSSLPYIPPGNKNSYTDAYDFLGAKWAGTNPNIMLSLSNDATFAAKGLDRTKFKNALLTAKNTWDAATPSSLFSSAIGDTWNGPSLYPLGVKDNVNCVGWRDLGTGGVTGQTCFWTKEQGMLGKGTIVEADIAFNSKQNWVIGQSVAGKLEVGTIALHELGHLLGMAHPYYDGVHTHDPSEIMVQTNQRTNWVQTNLGVGDKKGIKLLYPG